MELETDRNFLSTDSDSSEGLHTAKQGKKPKTNQKQPTKKVKTASPKNAKQKNAKNVTSNQNQVKKEKPNVDQVKTEIDKKPPKNKTRTNNSDNSPSEKSNDKITKKTKNQTSNAANNFSKPGQKFVSPPNGDGTRAFYESLFEENPYSRLAIKYSIENGILTGTKHHDAIRRYNCLKEWGAFKGTFGGENVKWEAKLKAAGL